VTKAKPQTRHVPFSRSSGKAHIDAAIARLVEKAQTDPAALKRLTKIARAPVRAAKAFSQVVVSVATEAGPRIFKGLKANGPAMLQSRQVMLRSFEGRLYQTWKRPLDLLEMLIVASAEIGESVSAAWPWRESEDNDLVFDVTRRLQARACQVAQEVLALLKSGYAPGAHARWRTLHETAATTLFITKYGKDVAERFLAHEYIEAQKAAKQYQRYHRRLGHERYTLKELAAFRRAYKNAVKLYGPEIKDFRGYGWASLALRRRSPTFADIEKAVQLDHIRPYYKMASHSVHANVKAIRFSLALAPDQDLLLTGPSNLGLTDPGHGAAISLGQTTIAMLGLHPSMDSLSMSRVIVLFMDEIGEAFLKAEQRLDKRARKHSGNKRRVRRR
jgi:hypothetical protein